MADFALDLTKITGEYKERIDIVVKKISFELFSKVIMRSPVRTGRFRNNWQVGINNKPTETLEGEDKGGVNQTGSGASITKARAGSKVSKVKGGDVVYLTNNLPYAERLEDNWSPQTHNAGIVGVSVSEFDGIVSKMSKEVKK